MTDHRTEEGRAFLQDRLALFAKTLCAVFFGVMMVGVATLALYPGMRPPAYQVDIGLAIVGTGTLLVVWLLARRPVAYALWKLQLVELCLMAGAGILLGIAVQVSSMSTEYVIAPSIVLLLLIFGRAIIVPSTARRSALLSVAAMAPLVAGQNLAIWRTPALSMLPLSVFVIATVAYSIAAIAVSTVGSRVIYGLRAEVRQALQLGQYTLLEKIGEGGMGSVYKARHAMLRRPTAIKLLPLDRLGPASIERFEREVQLTSELTHPNTIAIFDYGRTADGVFYYAMEYLDGLDLETLVREYGAQPAPRVIHILSQAAGALAEAHARGLIHRDIKPANVILCERGNRRDVAKVVDFGLVKELARDEGVTGANIVTGTPGYIAPEVITAPDGVGAAADIYALGAVGYFLLSGQPVFSGATVAEICAHHVHKSPDPLASHGCEVNGAFEALLMRCLAKKPSGRPASAAALGGELDGLAIDRWTEDDAEAWWRAHAHRRDEIRARAIGSASTVALTVDLKARA